MTSYLNLCNSIQLCLKSECPRGTPQLPPIPMPEPPGDRLFRMKSSDIDKYSRMIFLIFFLGFHLMYWSVFLTISDIVVDDLVYLH